MVKETENQTLWHEFSTINRLTDYQLSQFQAFYNLLKITNKLHNITAITETKSIINNHFNDSLALCNAIDFSSSNINFIADVGSGGGFPGIPLKIKFPHLRVILIEVIQKKVNFLESVINDLNLKNIEVSDLDWRTFLRKTDYPIKLFCARASLRPQELLRAFKPSSLYKNTEIAYWASKNWVPQLIETKFIKEEFLYTIMGKDRKLIFFQNA